MGSARLGEASSVPFRRLRGAGLSDDRRSLQHSDLILDPLARRAIIEGRSVALSRREFDLLYQLAQSPGRVVSYERLLQDVWGTTDLAYLPHLRSSIKNLIGDLADRQLTKITCWYEVDFA